MEGPAEDSAWVVEAALEADSVWASASSGSTGVSILGLCHCHRRYYCRLHRCSDLERRSEWGSDSERARVPVPASERAPDSERAPESAQASEPASARDSERASASEPAWVPALESERASVWGPVCSARRVERFRRSFQRKPEAPRREPRAYRPRSYVEPRCRCLDLPTD